MTPHDRDLVVSWARQHGLRVTAENAMTRRIALRGPAERCAQLFGVELSRFSSETSGRSVEYRGHTGPVRLPQQLAGVVTSVLGLDDRPIAHPHVRQAGGTRPALVSYDPPEVAGIYAYPHLPAEGRGMQLVAGMIELGGVVHSADVAASFARLGLTPPTIVNVAIDGAVPRSDPDGADVEIALDYQVIGAMIAAMAPHAQVTIVSYNAPNTERGFVDAVAAAAADDARRPSAVSISWGGDEDGWSLQGMRAMDDAFATGSLRGLTYSAAAGDQGSADAHVDGLQHPEFPASSPHVWSCGGTTMLAVRGRIVSEAVWNELRRGGGAAGSGVSGVFAPPSYQRSAGIEARSIDGGVPGRGMPDASGVADPLTGWNIVALGSVRTAGGTSAVAPMYTALWTLGAALQEQRIGLPHPQLYAGRGRGFNDITMGNTGGPYSAARGWDAASGWGSPVGRLIVRQLSIPLPRLAAQRRVRREAHAVDIG